MGVYIPNMSKPKDCSECILADKHLNGLYEAKYYCRLEADSCPLIEIDLVRCGECKWWNKGFCNNGRADANLKLEGNCFCDEGERRADEN